MAQLRLPDLHRAHRLRTPRRHGASSLSLAGREGAAPYARRGPRSFPVGRLPINRAGTSRHAPRPVPAGSITRSACADEKEQTSMPTAGPATGGPPTSPEVPDAGGSTPTAVSTTSRDRLQHAVPSPGPSSSGLPQLIPAAGSSNVPALHRPMERRSFVPHAVVVGGSLSGLCAALALSRHGWRVTVLEKSTRVADGMGISIDRQLLSSITGTETRGLAVLETGFPAIGWGQLHQFLAAETAKRPAVQVQRGRRATGVHDEGPWAGATVHTDDGDLRADLVIGADGEASTVRRFVAPQRVQSIFSGIMLWRGVVPEDSVAGGFGADDLSFSFRPAGAGMLATYGIPGSGPDPLSRRGGVFIWFDATRTALLRRTGKLEDDRVLGTLEGSDVPGSVVDELVLQTRAWPSPWREGVASAVRQRNFIGTPLAEYLPQRLVRGGVALIGNAAHAVGPITGSGFHSGMLDVQALVGAVGAPGPDSMQDRLRTFEQDRLAPARSLVKTSRAWSHSFTKRT